MLKEKSLSKKFVIKFALFSIPYISINISNYEVASFCASLPFSNKLT